MPAYKKYFMHGTSHHMGLDTHDYGLLEEPMQENMVFTVEPGIYIPKENLGLRLEDNVVIQENGAPFNLMRDIPIEADEIEDLMRYFKNLDGKMVRFYAFNLKPHTTNRMFSKMEAAFGDNFHVTEKVIPFDFKCLI